MDIKEKNQIVYRTAYRYLLEIKPEQITSDELNKYFVGDHKDFSTLEDVFEFVGLEMTFCLWSSLTPNLHFNINILIHNA